MDFELEWLRPSLLICQVSGFATVEGCEAIMRATRSDPRFHPGIGMIIVETDVDAAALTADDIEQIAELSTRMCRRCARR
jgi:hypothetical protein